MDHPLIKISHKVFKSITHFFLCCVQFVAVYVIQSSVVYHSKDHHVHVDPEGVVEHKADEGKDREEVAYRKACW